MKYMECSFNECLYNDKLFNQYNIPFTKKIENYSKSRKAEFLAGRITAKKLLYYTGLYENYNTVPNIYIGHKKEPI